MSQTIKTLGRRLEEMFTCLMRDVPSFEVLNKTVLPYGLKQHTRSICWLAEQVILQNVKKRKDEYGIVDYMDPVSDVSAWDARLGVSGCSERAYVNIKVSDVTKPVRRNDIASVQKLIAFYREQPAAHLFYVVMMLEFDENTIHFRRKPVVRYYPWIGEFVVNPRNHHIQSIYETSVVERTTQEFLLLLRQRAAAKHVL